MKREDAEKLWESPESWKFGVFYSCEGDPRLMVPKRLRWTGWTLNFAHPQAYILLAALVVIATAPTLLMVQFGSTDAIPFFGAMFFSLVVVLWVTRFYSRIPG